MNTNTFMDELPMVIISSLAIVAIVVLLALHVVTADSFLVTGVFAPLLYFGANGLIRLNTSTSSQQLTTEQVQQLVQTLSGIQPPSQPAPTTPEPKPVIVPALPVPSSNTEPIPQQ